MFDENVINLTRKHPWMSFEEAWLLMKYSYHKNKNGEKYNTFMTLMKIDYGMYQWQSEAWIRNRLQEAKIKFNYKN